MTVRDVAKACGLSKSAVSMALNRDPSIPAPTRERVERAAQELGYRRDPLLSAVFAGRRRAGGVRISPTLALVELFPHGSVEAMQNIARIHGLLRSAAEVLGYRFEVHKPLQQGLSPERLMAILRQRGIRGLVVHDSPDSPEPWRQLKWENFSVVAAGVGSHALRFTHGGADPVAALLEAVRRLRSRGWKRIGLAMDEINDVYVDGRWRMAMNHLNTQYPPEEQVPVFEERGWREEHFYDWFNRYRPDAVLSMDAAPLRWLTEAGHRVGQDVAFAVLNASPEGAGRIAGIDLMLGSGLRTLMLILDSLVRTGEVGEPASPFCVVHRPQWVDGPTAPNRASGPVDAAGRL